MVALAPEQINMFERDGFVIVEGFLNRDEVRCAKAGIEPLFQGQFETGIQSFRHAHREGGASVRMRPSPGKRPASR